MTTTYQFLTYIFFRNEKEPSIKLFPRLNNLIFQMYLKYQTSVVYLTKVGLGLDALNTQAIDHVNMTSTYLF